MNEALTKFSDHIWVKENGFGALSEIVQILSEDEERGREALIRILEHTEILYNYRDVIASLLTETGLHPYMSHVIKPDELALDELICHEFHAVDGLDGIHLHSPQAKVYRALMDGMSVVLSAPTSFGKSLLIDAVIASGRYRSVVVIVPTIALIDETRRRLRKAFDGRFKIITHPTQERAEKSIYVLTQERFLEFNEELKPDFFVIDEFYKLSPKPNGTDERTFVLNHAFYRLFKSRSQFFMIGPNVQDISIDDYAIDFWFVKFNYSTVATEIRYYGSGTKQENAIAISRTLADPTLIYCRSSNSANELAELMMKSGIVHKSQRASELASWIRTNYHPQWALADMLDCGIAVHHGTLPRSLAYHLLRLFETGDIKLLLCTSTIIEGVNTNAKNIIIYDNQIANNKFDNFTFNNIKGRAGRMFRHFVGNVYVLHPPPDPVLPIVDIPAITQPDSAPESLLIQMDDHDLSERSKEQLRYLHAQEFLPYETIKENHGVQPSQQVNLAEEIWNDVNGYHRLLSWTGRPNNDQLREVCRLCYDFLLMEGGNKDDIHSAKQLHFMITRLLRLKSIPAMIREEAQNTTHSLTPTIAVERTLKFLRQWCEFKFPQLLSALGRIQDHIFTESSLSSGDYSSFIEDLRHLFMHPAATILEEYGLPYVITEKIAEMFEMGENIDDYIETLTDVAPADLDLLPIEQDMMAAVQDNI